MAYNAVAAHLTQATVSTSNVATTTNGTTLTAGDLYILVYCVTHATTPFTDTTTFTSAPMTWTKVLGKLSGNELIGAHIGYGTSSSAGAVNGTLTFSQIPAAGRYVMLRLPAGAPAGTNPVVASNTASGTGTTGTVTITSIEPSAAGNAKSRLSLFAHRANEVHTPDSTGQTWTEDLDAGNSTSVVWAYEFQRLEQLTDDTNTATWATSSFWAAWSAQLSTNHTGTMYDEDPIVGQRGAVPLGLDDDVWAVV